MRAGLAAAAGGMDSTLKRRQSKIFQISISGR